MFKDFGKLLKVAGQIRTKLPEVKARLAVAEFTASASPDWWELDEPAIKATVNGKLRLVALKISPDFLSALSSNSFSKLEDEEAEMLARLIKSAIADAQAQAAQAANEAMNELTGGINLPGMDEMI